jgi:hypothetical protein
LEIALKQFLTVDEYDSLFDLLILLMNNDETFILSSFNLSYFIPVAPNLKGCKSEKIIPFETMTPFK